jgi:hypothetical protein
MKKLMFLVLMLTSSLAFAQLKKDGTPDMRYKANQQLYGGSTYTTPTYNYGTINTDVRYQSGYIKTDGTPVRGHYKTNSNDTNWDNFSTTPNYNPYTGNTGTRAKDYSSDAYNYGKGQTIQTGPKGGQYYINSNGNKTYVPKRSGNGW